MIGLSTFDVNHSRFCDLLPPLYPGWSWVGVVSPPFVDERTRREPAHGETRRNTAEQRMGKVTERRGPNVLPEQRHGVRTVQRASSVGR